MTKDKSFVVITNHDIWLKLEEMDKKLERSCESASKAKWLAGISLSLVFLLLGWFIIYVLKN